MPDREDKIYAEYEDALFRLVMQRAAEEEGKRMMREAAELNGQTGGAPSPEERERFLRLLDGELHKREAAGRKKRTRTLLKRGALVLAATIAVFSILMGTVSAFRIQVFNFVLHITEKYTSFQLQESGGTGSSVIVDWKNAYAPTYLPDGYEASDIYQIQYAKSITFRHKQDDRLNIIYRENDSFTNLELDTENASLVKSVAINGNPGTLVIKDHLVTLAWTMDHKLFMVMGQADAELITRIAESVQWISS